MTIKLSITRILQQDKIVELFTWEPKHRFCIDTKRQLYHKLNKTINDMSIHQYGYKMEDINYYKDKIVYIFQYNDKQKYIPINECKTINYQPVLGKKTCKQCQHKRNYKKTSLCFLKGKVQKNSWYKCRYWQEKEKDRNRTE